MEIKATWILVLVAFLWALSFPLIGNTIKEQDPFMFVALRFSLAALFIIPIFFKKISKELLIAGVILGMLNCGSYLSQTIGLKHISSSRAAFVTGTHVIFIPFIAPLFKLQKISKTDLLSALICIIGLYILTGADLKEINYGDCWVLLGSFFISISISYVAKLSKNNFDPLGLASSQIMFTAILSWIVCSFFGSFDFNYIERFDFLYLLLYFSLFSTILTFTLQIKYQKYVPTQKVALIFCLEPIFATIFDFLINQTQIQSHIIMGGFIILSSIIILEFKKKEMVDV